MNNETGVLVYIGLPSAWRKKKGVQWTGIHTQLCRQVLYSLMLSQLLLAAAEVSDSEA